MNATECRRASRHQTVSGRYRNAAFAGFAAAAIVCGPVAGQSVPEVDGVWSYPPNTGSDWPMDARHAVHLPDGTVLLWDVPAAGSFLWEPVADTLTGIDIPATFDVRCSGHAGLPDGTTLVVGQTKDANIYTLAPSTGSPWQAVEDMTYARFYPTCTTLPDGKVLATAGTDNDPQLIPEVFDPGEDPAEGTWEELDITMNGIAANYPHMFVVPDIDPDVHKVFYSSGYGSYDPLYLLTFMLDIGPPATWMPVGGDPLFISWRTSAVMYEPGKVLKCGGNSTNGILAETATIDLTAVTPTWQLEDPMDLARRGHNLVLLPDGKILAVGGDYIFGNANDAELFDPELGTWRTLAAANIAQTIHFTAVLLPDGRVLSTGEEKAEIFSPPYLFKEGGDADRPEIGFAPTAVAYGTNFDVYLSTGSPVSRNEIEKVTLVRLGATTHGFDQNQRYMSLPVQIDI